MSVPIAVSGWLLLGALTLVLCSLGFGALAIGLWLGERVRNRDLRALVGAPVANAERPGGYQMDGDEPEEAAGRGLPAQVRPEEIEAGAKDLLTMAKAYGLELSPEQAREQA